MIGDCVLISRMMDGGISNYPASYDLRTPNRR